MTDERPPEEEGVLEPFTSLLEAAMSAHEMFLAFQAAGFTEQQALYLLAQTLRPEKSGE